MPLALDEFKRFLLANNVIAIGAGISFGQATLQLIRSFVGDVALPLLYMATRWVYRIYRPGAKGGKAEKSISEAETIRPGNFATELTTYVLILLAAFFLLDRVFRSMLLDQPQKTTTTTAQTTTPLSAQTPEKR